MVQWKRHYLLNRNLHVIALFFNPKNKILSNRASFGRSCNLFYKNQANFFFPASINVFLLRVTIHLRLSDISFLTHRCMTLRKSSETLFVLGLNPPVCQSRLFACKCSNASVLLLNQEHNGGCNCHGLLNFPLLSVFEQSQEKLGWNN